MDLQKFTELANLLRSNGDKILSSESTLTLSGSLLRALNDSFTLITENVNCENKETFEVLKPNNSKSPVFRDLQLIYDFIQKTALLCIVQYPNDEIFERNIDINKFRALKRLEVQKTNIKQIVGIEALRGQIEHLICVKCLNSIDDIIVHCGGDNTEGFMWHELRNADFSYNNLQKIDTAFEFAQYLQHLNLRHNQLNSLEALKWLPHLKTLDLSYNRLQYIPLLHADACKTLQSLNLSNNEIEELSGCIICMESLTDLDLSDNYLLDHTFLAPLSLLINLKFLNLNGNPLYYHRKHRLATAQFLHKYTATLKFILDSEPLTKAEKAVIGSQHMHNIVGFSHGSSLSINTTSLSSKTQTPASSVGSLKSFTFPDAEPRLDIIIEKRRPIKPRNAIIEDANVNNKVNISTTDSMSASTTSLEPHMETMKELQLLRDTYGADWLQSAVANDNNEKLDEEELKSSERISNFMDELSSSSIDNKLNNSEQNLQLTSSTPRNSTSLDNKNNDKIDNTLYISLNQTESTIATDASVYKSIDSINNSKTIENENSNIVDNQGVDVESDDEPEYLKNVYSATAEVESEASEAEDDEEIYSVLTAKRNEPIFLTLSSNYLREKDTITQRTKTKWSLRILESCERMKSNMLRINFDTLRSDRKERIYTVEDDLCQQLQNKLRDILSKRDLSEMNQIIYSCVKCACKFSREKKYQLLNQEIHCPECRCPFITQVDDKPDKPYDHKLSPASIVEESPINTVLTVNSNSMNNSSDNSIGSAGSLNESSSCSKISKSQSSFDSNQSVVGSTNADRDQEFKSNVESDVDIISNPSQSSIEVLDPMNFPSRKSSDDHRLIQIPNLETIIDQNVTKKFNLNEFIKQERQASSANNYVETKSNSNEKVHFMLTESSSSGSVTDSICTAYEQQQQQLQQAEKHITTTDSTDISTAKNYANENKKRLLEDHSKGSKIDEVLGAIVQSTNYLLSSSKKAGVNIQTGKAIINPTSLSYDECPPYKFNYMDFNDIDHRLKLYFYQEKFAEQDEHFKWIVRGRIWNENTKTLFDGIVVVSTCKCIVMEAFAAENNDVTKWLRQILSVSINRLECVQLLPWKMGLSLRLRDWGSILLLLQDILRTDSLLLHFANNALPPDCELNYQTAEIITKRLNAAIVDEKLKMCSLLNGCEINFEDAKRNFNLCALLITDNKLYITSSNKLNWLSTQPPIDNDIEVCMTQLMTNLVEVDRPADNIAIINFLDETQNKSEYWHCIFETKENAESSLNAIGESWEELFGVPLLNA